jgi:hypothetical protein
MTVMVVDPAVRGVTTPLELTEATEGADEVQLTLELVAFVGLMVATREPEAPPSYCQLLWTGS